MEVQLARMEGKIDLMNERHETTKADLSDVKQRLHGHANRITVLEADRHLRQGERQGVALSAKALHWLVAGGVVAAIAALLRAIGI